MSIPVKQVKKVLVAPLDWGLGHATRCIPLVEALLANGCDVLLAAEGPQAALLIEAFPGLTCINLEGYHIRYSRKALVLKLVQQLPRVMAAVRREHRWLQRVIHQHHIDIVLSDNRYGLWSKQCHCVLISHQLQPSLPKGWSLLAPLVRRQFIRLIDRFDACWVPDAADANEALSGKLGHPELLPPIPVQYIGWLSRFSKRVSEEPQVYKACIVLSGPEPQRSMLEEKLIPQLSAIDGRVMLVRGKPGEEVLPGVQENVELHNHLSPPMMESAFRQSEFLVSRGGYSTLMDAFTIGTKCICIPTPGQTEQEYLASRLQQQKAVLSFSQSTFDLAEAIRQAEQFPFQLPSPPGFDLKEFIEQWLLTMTAR